MKMIFGRTIKVINPDKTTKLYDYLDSIHANSQIIYTDPMGKKFQYEGDTLQNLIKYSVYDNNTWNKLNVVEYDFKGNITKETDANGNSARFEYDSADRLLKKTFYEKDTIKRSIGISYLLGYSTEFPQILTVTDEDGYISKFYYDIQDRLVKTESTPDNVNYYTTTDTYDYVGNKLTATDARDSTTTYTFDDLGRLIKQKNALGNETSYTYNSLNKVLTLEEPEIRLHSINMMNSVEQGKKRYIQKVRAITVINVTVMIRMGM